MFTRAETTRCRVLVEVDGTDLEEAGRDFLRLFEFRRRLCKQRGSDKQEDGRSEGAWMRQLADIGKRGASPHFSAGAISVRPCAGAFRAFDAQSQVPVPGSAQRSTAGGSPAPRVRSSRPDGCPHRR